MSGGVDEYEQFYRSIERLADEWQDEADRSIRAGFKTYLDPRTASAALRNRLADVSAPPESTTR